MIKYLLLFFLSINVNAQCDNPLFNALHDCRTRVIMQDCNSWSSIYDSTQGQCIHIYKNEEFELFISKLDNYKNLKALSLSKVKVNDFDFLKHFEQLEFLSIDFNRNHNFTSFVENLNKTKVHALEIKDFNNLKFLKWFNQLLNIKSVEIHKSNLKRINITLALDHLIISKSKRLRFIDVPNVLNLSLYHLDFKTFPEGLSLSESLKALHVTQFTNLRVDCPFEGFRNLEYLDLFTTRSNFFDSSCFTDNLNVKIQLFPE